MSTKTLLTADEYAGLVSEVPTELIRGEIVEMGTPGARHGYVCVNVAAILREWAKRRKAGFVLGNDSGVITERDPDTVRGADCQFIAAQRLPGGLPEKGYPSIPPDLAVEVVSESDRWSNIISKVNEYLDAGVREVWVVEPKDEFVEVFRPDQRPVRFSREAELTSEMVLPGFKCRVAELFE